MARFGPESGILAPIAYLVQLRYNPVTPSEP